MVVKVPPLAERKPVYISLPVGLVRFSSLETPDARFDPDRPKYNLTVAFTDEEIAGFREKIEKLGDEWLAQVKKENPKIKVELNDLPFKPDTDREKNPTGLTKIVAACDAYRISKNPETGESVRIHRPVPMFDREGVPIKPGTVHCYGGSRVRVALRIGFYAASNPKIGVGLTFTLDAVQVIKSSSGARDAAGYGFGKYEDEIEEGAAEAESAPFTSGQDL